MFSKGSSSSISLATVTPSLVTVGEPNFLSSTTLRPLGPRVAVAAFVWFFTPPRRGWRGGVFQKKCFFFAIFVFFFFFFFFFFIVSVGLCVCDFFFFFSF